jgi:hypothetical protein
MIATRISRHGGLVARIVNAEFVRSIRIEPSSTSKAVSGRVETPAHSGQIVMVGKTVRFWYHLR